MRPTVLILTSLLSIPLIFISATGGVLMNIFLLSLLLFWAAVLLITLSAGCRLARGQRILPVMVPAIILLALIVSVPVTAWPLRLAYVWSRPSLEAISERVRQGESFTKPQRAGFFVVRAAEISPDAIVCLWLDLDPSGRTGFVQTGPRRVPFNLAAMVGLDGRWQFISED